MGIRDLDVDIPGNGNGPLYHIHIWYDNGQDNIGFFTDGPRPEHVLGQPNPHDITDYRFGHDGLFHYDDRLMSDAATNMINLYGGRGMGQYVLFFNDCQDFVRLVLEEYNRLAIERGRPELRNPNYQPPVCECEDEMYSY